MNNNKEDMWLDKLQQQIKHNTYQTQNKQSNIEIIQHSFNEFIQRIATQKKQTSIKTHFYKFNKFNLPILALSTACSIFLVSTLYFYNKFQQLNALNNSTLFTLSDVDHSNENKTETENFKTHNNIILKITFNPESKEQDIRNLLQNINAKIINGPSAIGIYTISVNIEQNTNKDAFINSLKNNNLKLIETIQIVQFK